MKTFLFLGVLAIAPSVWSQDVDTSIMYLNETQIIEKYDYSYELHSVETEDNYQLVLIRILPKIDNPRKKIVFLNHGLFTSCFIWLGRGANVSLAFLLSAAGHDVWLQNNRGNGVSMGGGPTGRNYWDYGIDEMALYDTPAAIDYILDVTGVAKVDFIAHSQGNTMYAIMCIEKPEYQAKIDKFIGLAPVFSLKYASVAYHTGVLIGAVSQITTPNIDLGHWLSLLVKPCAISGGLLCQQAYYMVHGYSNEINSDLLRVILMHYPYHGSYKNLAHLGQWIDKKDISKFDYGMGNIRRYGSWTPPIYDVSKLTDNPKYIFYGAYDMAISHRAVEFALMRMPNIVQKTELPYGHNDFFFGLTVKEKINLKVVDLVNG